MNERKVVGCELVVARCNPATVLDLIEEALDQNCGLVLNEPSPAAEYERFKQVQYGKTIAARDPLAHPSLH